MAIVDNFNVLKTDGTYESRPLGAKGVNIEIGYDSSGNIITDSNTASTSTKNASAVLKDLTASIASVDSSKAKTNHAVSTTTYGAATTAVYGHVKIGSNISVNSGVISLSKANVTSALGYTPPTTDTKYSAATTTSSGLMSSSDKSKLDGIATSANNYIHPTTSGNRHIPSGGASTQILRWISDGQAVWDVDRAIQLQEDLNAEITRAKAKEDELQAAIDALKS